MNLVTQGDILPKVYSEGVLMSSHFLFIDEILIFSKASMHNTHNIKEALNLYWRLLGQVVNWEVQDLL